jgi:3-oxoacyl-[acyl-carrier protein] reductase
MILKAQKRLDGVGGSVDLSGQVAVVTAAASGIGQAIAVRLVADGARVVAGDINDAGLSKLEQQCGDSLFGQRCDVTSEADQAALIRRAVEAFGAVDIAVANAGVATVSSVLDQEVDAWRRVVDLTLTGALLTIKHAARAMKSGSIVAIASLNATQPAKGMGAYCAAKAGVRMLAEVAALELGPRGVRVNTVAPGLVETSATAPFWTVPGLVDEFLDNTPLRRAAKPEDIAAAVRYLAGPESAHVSGAYLEVDGGAHTGRYPDLPAAFAAAGPTTPAPEKE